ncbi:hypothetical protein Tco_1080948 [Tanacetum coccineum]|uniref:Secreted protein n=1 Tax=Tanacetum coccineum TaxID=301880 RepID=A0ABQ5HWA2_9ASTR
MATTPSWTKNALLRLLVVHSAKLYSSHMLAPSARLKKIRAQERNTSGAAAMRLKEADRMTCVDIIPSTK